MPGALVKYYYADDQKIPITPDGEHAAVDLSHEIVGTLAHEWERLKQSARPLVGRVGLIAASDLPHDLERALDDASALHPVYRHGDTLLVVLPEVRVEVEPKQKKALLDTIQKGPVRASIVRDVGGALVLQPDSGKGADALSLANLVHERLHPRMAQARFVRVVPGPGVRRP